MNRSTLEQLRQCAHLTPEQLREEAPELADEVFEELGDMVREEVASRVSEASKKLVDAVKNVGEVSKDDKLADVVKRGAKEVADEQIQKEADEVTRDQPLGESVGSIAQLETPIGLHPKFEDRMREAEVFKLTEVMNFPESAAESLVDGGADLKTLGETQLTELRDQDDITEEEVQQVANATSIYRVLDTRPELVEAVEAQDLEPVESPQDLVKLGPKNWENVLRDQSVDPPPGMSLEDYAAGLDRKVANLFPTAAVAQSLKSVNVDSVLEDARAVSPLAELNPDRSVFDVSDFSELDTGDLDTEEVESLRGQFESVNETINRYPGLGLRNILTDPQRSWEEKRSEIANRTGLVDSFLSRPSGQNVFGLDLAHGSSDLESLEFGDVSEQEERMVLSTLKAYQRAFSLTGDVRHGEEVVAGGYTSATGIAASQPESFVESVDLEVETAERYYEDAVDTAASVGAKVGIPLENYGDLFDRFSVSNKDEGVETFLRELPGYEDYFGPQDYCDCEHCRSILSPAAYFADLMGFVDDHITRKKYFGTSPPESHPLSLKSRRPDLWELELTCENTTGTVPYLDIINEVLENAVALNAGDMDRSELSDRRAVKDLVYGTKLPETGGDAVDSFDQPFLLSFERIAIYLEHFEPTLGEIARVLQASPSVRARSELEVSHREYTLITEPHDSISFLRSVYGIEELKLDGSSVVVPGEGGTVAPDAQRFLDATHLGRDEFGRVVTTEYVTGGGSMIRIEGEKRTDESVQNDIERVHNLTRANLDRAHRFTRLWRAVPWTIEELDLVLEQLTASGATTGIEGGTSSDPAGTLTYIARLLRLQSELDVPVEELVALWHELPERSTEEDTRALFDRVFNPESFMDMGRPRWPDQGSQVEPFLHPAFENGTSSEAEPPLRRLLAATGLDSSGLLALLKGLAGSSSPLDLQLGTGSVSDRKLALTRGHLNVLYRHARLSRLLDVEPATLLRLLDIAPEVSNGYIDGFGDLEAAVDVVSWRKNSSWSVAEIEYLLGGDRPTSVANPSEVATALVDRARSERMLVFADTLFAAVDGVTKTQSQAIVDKNSSRFVKAAAPGGSTEGAVRFYRLPVDFDFSSALNLPHGVDGSVEPDLRRTLRAYDTGRLVPTLLSEELGVDEDRLSELLNLLGADTTGDAYRQRVLGVGSPGTPIADLVQRILHLTVLFNDQDAFGDTSLAYVKNHLGVFGIGDIEKLNVPALRSLESYRQLLTGLDQAQVSALHQLLSILDSSSDYQALDESQVAEVLGVEEALIASLVGRLSVEEKPPKALADLGEAAKVASALGTGGEAMEACLASTYSALTKGASALVAAFRAKYDKEEEYEEAVRPFKDQVRSKKRDGLVEYLLYSVRKDFDKPSDLYHFYLLDVELEGCARTSPIVAANSSLQLYVQRVLMNLEQTGEEEGEESEQKAHVPPEAVPEDQWSWRKRYRLWEANRKVFLYPENYLEPGLRDNKSPLFERLEEELLSQEINEQNVRQAYARYLRGFEEVANLSIAGSFHQTADDADVLHLFGATNDDPPQYYYRRVENAKSPGKTQWKPWQKIEVQIPTDTVSPIVHQGRLYLFWNRYVTKPRQTFSDGKSQFEGYRHTMTVAYTKQRLDGSWVEPQEISLGASPFDPNDEGRFRSGKKLYRFSMDLDNGTKDFSRIGRGKPQRREGLKLDGYGWDRLYPFFLQGDLILRGGGFRMASPLNFYEGKIGPRMDEENAAYMVENGIPFINPFVGVLALIAEAAGGEIEIGPWMWGNVDGADTELYSYTGGDEVFVFGPAVQRSLLLRGEADRLAVDKNWSSTITGQLSRLAKKDTKLVTLDRGTEREVLGGSPTDCIIETEEGAFLLQEGVRKTDDKYLLRRLDTALADDIGQDLFEIGLDEMLSTENQLQYQEPTDLPFDVNSSAVEDATGGGDLPFEGPMGVYFRELFYHIPVLIANHLNSEQKYEEAREWYHKVFDPTADQVDGTTSPPSSNGTADSDKRPDRPWRYREFRELDEATLRSKLENTQAVEAYKTEPFNPHAVARQRMTAYQKSVVMKYVDNLIDWGDELFARDTREAIREATLYYTMASDILGDRPQELGDCGEGEGEERSYAALKDDLRTDVEDPGQEESEFLPEIESFVVEKTGSGVVAGADSGIDLVSTVRARRATARTYEPENVGATAEIEAGGERAVNTNYAEVIAAGNARTNGRARVNRGNAVRPDRTSPEVGSAFGFSVSRQVSPVFCIPNNEELLDYWDRVEDRLFKIRHCLNIEGEKRTLSLFAPPVSPDMLVRATASGMSIAEAMEAVTGNVPPYRFEFLMQKAKEYVGRLQEFGSSLQATLEKRDAEELKQLRNTHQKNLQDLTESIKEQELEAAQKEIDRLQKRKDLVSYRKRHYDTLISKGLIPTEEKKKRKRVTAKDLRTIAGTLDTMAGIVHLLPDVGAPTAMKFGGSQLGDSSGSWSSVLKTLASIQETQAGVAGMKATYRRRKQRWEHQKKQATKELETLKEQIRGAEIRRSIAESTLERHRQKQEQLDEIIDFHEEKFSDPGLYRWLADELQSLYRDAFNVAYGFVRMAARAYEFERNEYPEVSTSAWDASHSGLLAGERLMLDLERMEKQYLETDYRSNEIDQSFSLSQIDPAALIKLKETGSCTFRIPEFYFDLFYPGQYRRRIKAVRVTIPCVTGPHTNVSAELSLLNSWIRRDPNSFDPADPTKGQVQLPPTRSTSVATSTAQNDSGVFNLNFRGNQYMPFEGAGAISKWQLQLPDPEGLPPFDYDTISDVTLTISYTAEENRSLRTQVSGHIQEVQRQLSDSAQMRVISLRRELSPSFNRLVRSPAGTTVDFEISEKHFPTFLQGQTIKVQDAYLVVDAGESSVGSLELSIDGTAVKGFQPKSEYGNLPRAQVDKSVFRPQPEGTYPVRVKKSGNLGSSGNQALDDETVEDIYLALRYHVPSS